MLHVIRTSALIAFFWLSAIQAQAGSVIVSSDVRLESVSRQFLLSVFSMRLNYWDDGTPVQVFVFPDDHSVHHTFTKRYLGVFPYQLRNHWDRAVFTGSGSAPVEVADTEQMLEMISSRKGAIGYIDHDLTDTDNVRVIHEY